MVEESQSEIPSVTEVKEEVISDLDGAVKSYDDGDIDGFGMLARACSAWKKVNGNSELKQKLEVEM
jgi:hypothetical protein